MRQSPQGRKKVFLFKRKKDNLSELLQSAVFIHQLPFFLVIYAEKDEKCRFARELDCNIGVNSIHTITFTFG